MSHTSSSASAESAQKLDAGESVVASEAPYTPLDIADPDGRFGSWMPGDDPDDWR